MQPVPLRRGPVEVDAAEVHRIDYASHVAYLCPNTGEGLLVLPLPADDLPDPLGGASLHAGAWDAVVRHLDHLGWEPTEDEGGGLCLVGVTSTGREVVGLYGREPVLRIPEPRQSAEALHDLATAAGIT